MIDDSFSLLEDYLNRENVHKMALAMGLACGGTIVVYDCQGRCVVAAENMEVPGRLDDADDAQVLHTAPLLLDGDAVGSLALLRGEGTSVIDPARACSLIDSHAGLLSDMLSAEHATRDLASELSERYEELSLVYELGAALDISKRLKKALDMIADPTVEMLRGDLLVIAVPTLSIRKVSPGDPSRSGEVEQIIATVLGEGGPVGVGYVLNNLDKGHALGATSQGFAHAMVVPLNIAGEQGTVILLRRDVEDRFMTGDRKLFEAIASQTAIVLSNARIAEQREEISDIVVFSLARLSESRDPETGAHLERLSEFCELLSLCLARRGKHADAITDEFTYDIHRSAPLHDIGKVGIPDSILLKEGKLTPEEWNVMRTHTTIGGDTLRDAARQLRSQEHTFLTMGCEIAYSHHEKWDGSGYPTGIAGTDIPLSARLVALVDVYDALTSKRCYKPAMDFEEAEAIIAEGRGSHFDPDIFDAFEELASEFRRIKLKSQRMP